jgi:two-component sensor histidine kinase
VLIEARSPRWRIARAADVLFFAIAVVTIVVASIATITISHADWLPALIGPQGWTGLDDGIVYAALLAMLASVAVILFVIRERNELWLWLALALAAMVLGNLLSQLGAGRYTIGWSVSRLSWVFSGAVLFLYFMAQLVRQQSLLGRSRDALERAVAARTGDLVEMIGQRDLLLREVHHRVKNNFQVINSLISYQTSHSEHDETRAALQSLHSRVYALGLVHQRLMQSDDLATFDIRAFLSDLCINVAALAAADARGIVIKVDADPLQTDLDFAGPLGLLVTELVSAAFSHFAADQHGAIGVTLHRLRDSNFTLEVADDAPREPDLIDAARAPQTRIVRALVTQLSGTIESRNPPGTNGTIVRVFIPFSEERIRSGGTAKFS